MKNEIEERLTKALVLEKHFNPDRIRSVLKSDIFTMLKNYGDIDNKEFSFDIVILDDANYEIEFKAKLNNIKTFKCF